MAKNHKKNIFRPYFFKFHKTKFLPILKRSQKIFSKKSKNSHISSKFLICVACVFHPVFCPSLGRCEIKKIVPIKFENFLSLNFVSQFNSVQKSFAVRWLFLLSLTFFDLKHRIIVTIFGEVCALECISCVCMCNREIKRIKRFFLPPLSNAGKSLT